MFDLFQNCGPFRAFMRYHDIRPRKKTHMFLVRTLAGNLGGGGGFYFFYFLETHIPHSNYCTVNDRKTGVSPYPPYLL